LIGKGLRGVFYLISIMISLNLTERDRILRIFERKEVDRVPWMPRIDHWYNFNRTMGTLPKEFKDLSLSQIYFKLNAYWRCYRHPYIKIHYEGDVEIEYLEYGDLLITRYKTPIGVLEERRKKVWHKLSSRIIKYLVSELSDIKVLEYILENIRYEFSLKEYRELEKHVGKSGMLWYYFPRTPLQRLLINYMGVKRTFIYLYKYRDKIEGLMESIAKSDDRLYEIVASSPLKILNFGDNIDARITSPKLFKKYCIPYYQERVDYLHKRNKFIHCHVDGYAKPLLHLFKETGWDGVEALTIQPVGDITLKDIKKSLDYEMILIDGIPYIYFITSSISLEKFRDFVKEIIHLFPNKLILGISDELPPLGDINRVKLVSNIVKKENL